MGKNTEIRKNSRQVRVETLVGRRCEFEKSERGVEDVWRNRKIGDIKNSEYKEMKGNRYVR